MEKFLNNTSFNAFILKSFALHLGLILLFQFKGILIPTDDFKFQNSMRVDLVALPDKTVQKKRVSKKKAKPKIKKKSAKKDKKPSIKEALDKIKADLAIERFTKEMENSKDKGKDVKEQKPAEKLEYKGNKITTGESLKGLDRTSMERYYAQLKNHIHKSWTLPPWLEELNLKAKAYVNIDESGHVIQRGVELSSGNEQFDKIMLAAIDQSSPLPEPPLRLKLMLKHRGFVLNFPD